MKYRQELIYSFLDDLEIEPLHERRKPSPPKQTKEQRASGDRQPQSAQESDALPASCVSGLEAGEPASRGTGSNAN